MSTMVMSTMPMSTMPMSAMSMSTIIFVCNVYVHKLDLAVIFEGDSISMYWYVSFSWIRAFVK